MRKSVIHVDYEKIRQQLEIAAQVYKPRNRAWTAQENEIIREFYGKISNAELASKLNRGIGSVMNHARELGIQKK